MLSLFAVPKPFVGRTATVQDNAIGSWIRLGSGCEVILFGDDAGVAEAAARHGVRHEPVVARNDRGTPILRDVLTRIDTLAEHPILGFVNADIILLSDFLTAFRAISQLRQRFLMISSRFNCCIDQPLSFDLGWDTTLRARARTENRMYPAAGSDIFIYPRGLFSAVPPFAIGRGYWDNWLMYEARRLGAPLIDATAVVTAIHPDHGYDHVGAVSTGLVNEKHIYESEEGRRNLELAGGWGCLYTAYDATEILTAEGGLVPTWRPRLVRRRLKAWLRREVKMRTEKIFQ